MSVEQRPRRRTRRRRPRARCRRARCRRSRRRRAPSARIASPTSRTGPSAAVCSRTGGPTRRPAAADPSSPWSASEARIPASRAARSTHRVTGRARSVRRARPRGSRLAGRLGRRPARRVLGHRRGRGRHRRVGAPAGSGRRGGGDRRRRRGRAPSSTPASVTRPAPAASARCRVDVGDPGSGAGRRSRRAGAATPARRARRPGRRRPPGGTARRPRGRQPADQRRPREGQPDDRHVRRTRGRRGRCRAAAGPPATSRVVDEHGGGAGRAADRAAAVHGRGRRVAPTGSGGRDGAGGPRAAGARGAGRHHGTGGV